MLRRSSVPFVQCSQLPNAATSCCGDPPTIKWFSLLLHNCDFATVLSRQYLCFPMVWAAPVKGCWSPTLRTAAIVLELRPWTLLVQTAEWIVTITPKVPSLSQSPFLLLFCYSVHCVILSLHAIVTLSTSCFNWIITRSATLPLYCLTEKFIS